MFSAMQESMMDGNSAAAIGSVCGVIIVLLQVVNNIATIKLQNRMKESMVIRQSNSDKLDVMSDKLDHVHTCVEMKTNEIKAAVSAGPAVGAMDVTGTLEVRPKEGT